MKYYLGIELGGTKFQAVIGDSNTKIIDRYRTIINKERGGAAIRNEICKVLNHFRRYNLVSIGLGFGGPVDYKKGKIYTSHQIDGWDGFPIASWLRKKSGLPVQIDNDANCGGLAEAIKGAGKKFQRVFFVTLGSGMGGGMILNRQIYHGEIPGESEVGMMPYNRSGTRMESECCGWSVDRKIREYVKSNPDSILGNLTSGINGGEAKHLYTAVNEGDKGAIKILDETADNIAYALSYVVLLFHPGIIILGGGLSLIGEPLTIRINKNLPNYIVPEFHPCPAVEVSKLGEDVICTGALLLTKQVDNSAKNINVLNK